MLEKISFVDSITVDLSGILSVRRVAAVMEDGTELSRSYHRHTLAPGDDLAGQDDAVVAIANAVWTPELIQAYQDRTAAPLDPEVTTSDLDSTSEST
jgi:hypothetical protein